MYTVDPEAMRPREKVDGLVIPQAATRPVPLLTIIGIVVAVALLVAVLVLVFGGSVPVEVHDSWMNTL